MILTINKAAEYVKILLDDIVVNRNYYAVITLYNGWIETLRPTRHEEALEVYKSAVNALDTTKTVIRDDY